MAAYLIAIVKVNDDAWIPDYAKAVHDIAAKYGGEYLSRTANVTMLEGDDPDANVIALIKFPDTNAVDAFVNDPDYKPYADARKAGTDSRFYRIDDVDATGGVPYLPKP